MKWNGGRRVYWRAWAAAEERLRGLARIVDAALDGRHYLSGAGLGLADIALGPWAWRWVKLVSDRPALANLDGWIARLQSRPAYASAVMTELR